ncbi:MAG: hypothetical protein L6R36_009354 [Xanthoria steineri]|nr:MAG: hypothetical protein L6R36_009354 [Xanthoria steineri]
MAYHRPLSLSQYVLILLSFALCLLNLSVHATPLAQAGSPFAAKPAFPSLDDCRKKITAPEKDKAMYFTGLPAYNDVKKAKKYAVNHGLTHVTNCYPTNFAERGQYAGDDDAFRQFQKDFSQAYAEKTEGIAYLMLDDNQNAAPDSIFYTVELEAMKNGGHVDKILQFPFDGGKGIDDPTKATKVYWEKFGNAAAYSKGQCGVHVTHYQIPKGDTKYYLQAQIQDANHFEIGHLDKTDATEPVNVNSALPLVLVITAAKPGSSEDPDGAPLQFAYGADKWSSDDARCKFGGYENGNREGDCGFAC